MLYVHLILRTAFAAVDLFLRTFFLSSRDPQALFLFFNLLLLSFAFLGCSFSIWFLNVGCLLLLYSIPRCPISPMVVNIMYMLMCSFVSSPDLFSSEFMWLNPGIHILLVPRYCLFLQHIPNWISGSSHQNKQTKKPFLFPTSLYLG